MIDYNPIDYSPEIPAFPTVNPFLPCYGKFDLTTYIQGASDYEIMANLVELYNTMAKGYNDVQKLSTDTATAFNQLQSFVNSFFSDLNIQNEIDAKLNSMIADGSFTPLLEKAVSSSVTNWLSKNVIPTGSAVVVDQTLSIAAAAADAKTTGQAISTKINRPALSDDGKVARAKNTVVEWVDVGTPTDEQTNFAVNAWLNAHPDATTTVKDNSITENKINNSFMPYIKNAYVTPQMFGAKGDGTGDDTIALQAAINSGKPVFIPNGRYNITSVTLHPGTKIFGTGVHNYTNIADYGSIIQCTSLTNSAFIYNSDCEISDITIYYPNQSMVDNTPAPYPATFSANTNTHNVSIKNIYSINSYILIDRSYNLNGNSKMLVSGIYGYVIKTLLILDRGGDVDRVENIHLNSNALNTFSDDYRSAFSKWTRTNGIAIRIGRSDAPILSNIFIWGYRTAISFEHIYYTSNTNAACLNNISIDGCGEAITGYISNSTFNNIAFAIFNSDGTQNDISEYAINLLGAGNVLTGICSWRCDTNGINVTSSSISGCRFSNFGQKISDSNMSKQTAITIANGICSSVNIGGTKVADKTTVGIAGNGLSSIHGYVSNCSIGLETTSSMLISVIQFVNCDTDRTLTSATLLNSSPILRNSTINAGFYIDENSVNGVKNNVAIKNYFFRAGNNLYYKTNTGDVMKLDWTVV